MKILLIIDLIVLNSLVAFLVFKFQTTNPNTQTIINNQVPITKNFEFEDLVRRVGDLELTPYPSPAPAGTSGQIKTVTVAGPTVKLVKSINYVTVPGSGETNNLSWTDLTGTDFYFDKSEYAGLQNITMESSIRLFNGSGIGYLRLFDVTHEIAVVGSEVYTASQSESLVSSGNLNVWSGKNLYRIQARSNSADRLIYNWGKLKIVTQN